MFWWCPYADKALFLAHCCSTQKYCDTVKPCESHKYYKNNLLLPNRALLLSGNMSLPMGLTVARVRVKDLSRVEPNTEHKTKLYAWYINIWNYTLASMCEVIELYKNTTQNFKVQVTTFPSSIMYKCAIQNQQLDSMLYTTYRTLNVFII